ncbi:MAG: glycosyltransferase family 2 protein, partial [Bacteroidales bacterium]|nr:glycosyltransferase family 2 protein [Bacteroidales bacterium]
MAEDICVIIPIYDNAGTIRDVASRALGHCKDVFVVDDGSNDSPGKELEGLPVRLVRHDRNKGKGKAFKTGFKAARAAGFKKAITLDGDGQHYPEDLPAFFEMADKHPDAMLIGSRNLRMENMPGKNTFANKFSNFWFKIQTGVSLPDTQSGFR